MSVGNSCPNCPSEDEVELVRWAMSLGIEQILTAFDADVRPAEEILETMKAALHEGTPDAYGALRRLSHGAKECQSRGAIGLKELVELFRTRLDVDDQCEARGERSLT